VSRVLQVNRDAFAALPLVDDVVEHVGEEQEAGALLHPDGSLGEPEPIAQQLRLGLRIDDLVQRGVEPHDGERAGCRCLSAAQELCADANAEPHDHHDTYAHERCEMSNPIRDRPHADTCPAGISTGTRRSSMTTLASVPMPLTVTSTRSPGTRKRGGS